MSENIFSKEKCRILYVDDEKINLESFRAIFRKECSVTTALSADEGLEIIKSNPEFPIILSDQRMPDKTGVEFLEETESYCPDSLRVLISAYTDIEVTIAAVNQGRIFYYISKPWDIETVRILLKKGFSRYYLEKENRELTEEKKVLLLRAEKEEKEKIRAQLEVLRNQVNPHFLFNSLNTLYALVRDNTNARDYVKKLSSVFRYILEQSDRNLVPLSEEISCIRDFLFLQKIRFREGLTVNIEIPEHFSSHMVPANSIQLLIENVFKHNVVSSENPLTIDVFVDCENRLVIRNNHQPRTDAISTGIGHKNLIDRYSLLDGGKPLFTLSGDNYIATIPLLPFIPKS